MANSGWDDDPDNLDWNSNLTADTNELKTALNCGPPFSTYSDTANDNLPMNCVTWYEAFAFCAWDGGRLQTEAEWNYVAARGSEQSLYPWPFGALPDTTLAVYDCKHDGLMGCAFTDIPVVGSRSPQGNSKWFHTDISGGIGEWGMDWYENPTTTLPCVDCALVRKGTQGNKVLLGGSFYEADSLLQSDYRDKTSPTTRAIMRGVRCARPL